MADEPADLLLKLLAEQVPSLRDVVSEIMVGLNGTKGFAAELVRDYKAAPAGSASRVRLGGMILDAVKVCASMEDPLTDEGMADAETMKAVCREHLANCEKEHGEPEPA